MIEKLQTIVYRADYVRPLHDKKRSKQESDAIALHNRKHRNAPDKCWDCIHFSCCSMSDARDCDGWKENNE